MRHARNPQRAEVAIAYCPDRIQLAVRDDGQPAAASAHRPRPATGCSACGNASPSTAVRWWPGRGPDGGFELVATLPLEPRERHSQTLGCLDRRLIVDDQALVRAGFRMILEIEPDLHVVGEAGDGEQAVAQVAALRPDVVLMDVRMPGLDGIAATQRTHR